ncbi:MAG: hypothetical protein FWD61_20005 [Phycisphaerales bacterium]|nr:hypothetical protein [Phycisphaerales bacterium]
MVAATKITIEVDVAVADILRRADAHARARGETLSTYLERAVPRDVVKDTPTIEDDKARIARQTEAWNRFVREMTALVTASVPPGHVADDSRDSIYD